MIEIPGQHHKNGFLPGWCETRRRGCGGWRRRIISYHLTGLGGRQKGDKSRDNTIKMDFCQADARQSGDEAEARGGRGELEGIISYHTI